MAISACMQCLKSCGYLCGGLAALNIWFWIGMTVFNAMGNPWITKEILMMDNFVDPDAEKFTWVFGACVLVSLTSATPTIKQYGLGRDCVILDSDLTYFSFL